MSLLMDALKKAELAKRQGQSGGANELSEPEALGGLALEPIPDSVAAEPVIGFPARENGPTDATLPPLAAHLEELDARFLAEAAEAASARLKPTPLPMSEAPGPRGGAGAAPGAPTPADSRRAAPDAAAAPGKAAVQNLFAAKQPEKPPTRKAFAIAVGTVTVLSVCGIGGYFWWQLQPKSTLVANRPIMPPAPAAAPAATLPVPPTTTSAIQPPTAASSAPAAGPSAQTRSPGPVITQDDDEEPATVAAKAPPPARRGAASVREAYEPDSPVRVTRAPLTVNPALQRGFEAFNRGDLVLAQVEYERARKSDPRNTDALHGLAAIAIRQGRHDLADQLYRQITEADPQDTVAMSALINNRGQIDPNTAESRLKSLAAAQPELAAPHFSLGNLYARHGRWSEAQQAYFRAYSAEPDNPDILYNLAISLEHLRQNKLAAQYYSQAIAAAQGRPAGFDKAQASARLQALQP